MDNIGLLKGNKVEPRQNLDKPFPLYSFVYVNSEDLTLFSLALDNYYPAMILLIYDSIIQGRRNGTDMARRLLKKD